MILVTGGAGFIGGNFVLDWLSDAGTEGSRILVPASWARDLGSNRTASPMPVTHFWIAA